MLKLRIMIVVIGLCLNAHVAADSLFSDASYSSVHADERSLKAGDIITVLIYEQASASTSAGTDTNRQTGVSGSLTKNDRRDALDGQVGSNFEGGGSISREGQLVASVSVSIQRVLDNGDLEIQGQQLIEFNDEKQHIRLQGRVRPQDVSANNTVISSRVADGKITYVGDGLLGKQQKPGLLSKLMGWIF